MDILVFFLIGAVTAAGSTLMLIRFDSSWLKAFSLTGGASVLVGELVIFAKALGIDDAERSSIFASLLLGWLIFFPIILMISLRSLKRQSTKYKLHTWEILLGDKKAIKDYYESKNLEISKKIENEYNFKELSELKEEVDNKSRQLTQEAERLADIRDEVDEILEKKHQIQIPKDFQFPIRKEFFLLLPRYIKSISEFEHHLSSFTNSFIEDINSNSNKHGDTKIIKTYLSGLSYYVGQYLFDWRDVRVHFRGFNQSNNCYEKFVAVHRHGEDYLESLTEIPAEKSLIALATESKRSIVFSANKNHAFDTGSEHIWKDYITMVFEKLHTEGQPVLSLGVSVKHHVDHKEMLYFLSFIQIEQVIQENLLRLDESISICNSVTMEAA